MRGSMGSCGSGRGGSCIQRYDFPVCDNVSNTECHFLQVRPLLAATRNDEELHKKELELALARERAERDHKEREALEGLKMRLESEKRKIEEDLEAERSLGVDKDALLERSKKREAELEEEVAALQGDLDTLDSQLDRALKIHAESEEKHEALKAAFDHAAEALVLMETKQEEYKAKEAELSEQFGLAQDEADALREERDDLEKATEELKNLVLQREEDLARAKERMEASIADLDKKLRAELTSRYVSEMHLRSHLTHSVLQGLAAGEFG